MYNILRLRISYNDCIYDLPIKEDKCEYLENYRMSIYKSHKEEIDDIKAIHRRELNNKGITVKPKILIDYECIK